MTPEEKEVRRRKHGGTDCPFWVDKRVRAHLPVSPGLRDYVSAYCQTFRENLRKALALYRGLDFAEAVASAGLLQCPVCGSLYPHQSHIRLETRQEFSAALLTVRDKLACAVLFEDLWAVIRPIGEKTRGIARLTAYETALRIGFHLGSPPKDYVYGFNGASIAEGRHGQRVFSLNAFRPELASDLTAYEIEDFLCVFHKERRLGYFTVLK